MATHIQYCGIEYKSLKALFNAKASDGISYITFYNNITKGWDLERALTEQPRKITKRTYMVDGIQYKTLKELANAAGILYVTAVKRMHAGYTDEEIFNGKRNTNNITFTIRKYTMFEGLLSRTEVSKRLGICTDTVTRWVKEGYIPEPVCIGGRRLFWKVTEIEAAKDKILNNRKE